MNVYARIVALFLFFIAQICSGQSMLLRNICDLDSLQTIDGQNVVWIADEEPSFPGGQTKLSSFIKKEFKYVSKKTESTDELILSLLIDAEGVIRNYCIRESDFKNSAFRESAEQEAFKVVSKMPKWNPAKQNGKPIPILYNLSFFEKSDPERGLKMLFKQQYERGELIDGYKVGAWEYFDSPEKLALKIDYDSGRLLYQIPDSSEYSIKINDDWVNTRLDIQPRYIGSMTEFYNIINDHISYPLLAKSKQASGRLYLTFEIDTLGSMCNISVVNDPGFGCASEAIQAIGLVPNLWIPAQKNLRKYSSRFVLPFNFVLKSGTRYFSGYDNPLPFPEGKILSTIFITASASPCKDCLTSEGENQLISPIVDPDKKIHSIVDIEPRFPGGDSEMFAFISKNLTYPQNAMENGVQGKVYMTFVVDTVGRILEAKILRGIDKECDKEALRVINSMPIWFPGEQDGKYVQVQYNLPINFKIEGLIKKGSNSTLDTYAFNSTTRLQITKIVQDDFGRGNTMDYNIGENNLTIMFTIDENGQPGNFQALNSWGRQFIGAITRGLRTQITFPKEEKTMYFHLNMRFNEGHVYEYTFNLSDKREVN